MRTFRSDNNAGLCPEAMAAIAAVNEGGHELAYGDDASTARAEAAIRRVLGDETRAFFVATGTAANTLAIAALTEPWQQVICHEHSHYNDDESTAPERLTHCRVAPIRTDEGKLTPAHLEAALRGTRGDVHQPQPGVLTISNPTEFGMVYTPDETRALCDLAHAAGYRVHVDGARFANAVAAVGGEAADLGPRAGVDALSFGGTKNGIGLGEAVCFFPQGDGAAFARAEETFPFHRKGTGHLFSKHRFLTAPFAATLDDGCWLRHAAHANAMAARLAEGLAALGVSPRFATEANGVFVSLPDAVDEALQRAGHGYYRFGDPTWAMARLMCSFDTDESEVRGLLDDVAAAIR